MADDVTGEVSKEFGITGIAQVVALGIARVFGEMSVHGILAFGALVLVLTVRPILVRRLKARYGHHLKPPAVHRVKHKHKRHRQP